MASSVGFSGVGSGIDFNAIRDAIINQRAVPINQMQTRVSAFNKRVDSLKQMNGLLATLTTATQNLTHRDVGTARSATFTDATVASVTATSAASLGSLDLSVTRLATHLTQTSRSYTSADAPVLTDPDTPATFEFRKAGAATGVSVTIDATNNTLTGLRDAINGKNAGVTANIVDVVGDGAHQQLVLTSTDTGASGRVELVETTSTGTGTDLAISTLNPVDGDFSKLDAVFSINGLSLTRSSNNISDAVAGLNITLKKAGTSTLQIGQSSEIGDDLKTFADAYNAVQDFIAGQYVKDSDGKPTGVLAGDQTLRSVQKQLSSITGITSTDNGGTLSSLSQIGIELGKDGHMSVDQVTLDQRLSVDPTGVQALLYGATTAQTGIFQKAYTVTNALSDNISGSVQTSINGYQSSVKSLNDTIAHRTATLTSMRDSLTRQFAIADAAIGQLNGQGTALTNIIKSLQGSGN
jgi:flagellar hook-associated protein 2